MFYFEKQEHELSVFFNFALKKRGFEFYSDGNKVFKNRLFIQVPAYI